MGSQRVRRDRVTNTPRAGNTNTQHHEASNKDVAGRGGGTRLNSWHAQLLQLETIIHHCFNISYVESEAFMLLSDKFMSDSSATPWTVGCQAPLSKVFVRQEYWSGLPFQLQGIFLTQGSSLLHCQADSLPPTHLGSPKHLLYSS